MHEDHSKADNNSSAGLFRARRSSAAPTRLQQARVQRRLPLPGKLPELHGLRQVRKQAAPDEQLQQRTARAQAIAATAAGKAGDGEEKEEAPLHPKGTKLFNNNITATSNSMRAPSTGQN